MNILNKDFCIANDLVPKEMFDLPERVLQFGTGVLLRGLPDYLINKANQQGIFNGRIVVVKSTDGGDAAAFNRQDNLYTLVTKGIENGVLIDENSICSAISRVLSAKNQWQEVLDCAANPDLTIVISNTTEMGIQLVQDDIRQEPPTSFPGKLLAFLYARYKAFNGDKNKGLVIVPTELIVDNALKLEEIVLELAHLNALESPFIDWLENHNAFCNSLVDRIVPGKPDAISFQKMTEELGYQDDLLTMSEVYILWAIEGDERIKSVLSFHQADKGVVIEQDIEQYRELKLRLLNGTHTLSCGLAFLSGFTTVKEAMQNEAIEAYISRLMLSEIAPSIPYPMDENLVQRFGEQVLDRFRNPYIEHRWISITMNYTSKMAARNVPTLLHYYKNMVLKLHQATQSVMAQNALTESMTEGVPMHFALGFAAYLLFMKAVKCEKEVYYGELNGHFYPIQDDKAAYFNEIWQKLSVDELVEIVLKNQNLWGTDLSVLPNFNNKIVYFLNEMLKNGVFSTLDKQLVNDEQTILNSI